MTILALRDNFDLLWTGIRAFFNNDLALQNDYLRQENKILRGKLGRRVPLKDSERRLLVKYAMRVKDHLDDLVSIVRPRTLLAWRREMKRRKWIFA